MLIQTLPDAMTKLALMGDATTFEPVGDKPQQERLHAPYQSHGLHECITNVATPKGKKSILKAMVTTACERNCYYCPFRAGRSKMKRLTFTPDELASSLFWVMGIWNWGWIRSGRGLRGICARLRLIL